MASVGITGATSGRGCRWRRWWSTRIGGTGWSSTTRRPRGSWAGTSTRADGGEAFHRHAVTVMLAYSFLVWQEWQQRQERARPGRPRRAFPPRADRRRRTLPEIHRQICDWLRHEAAKESVLRELMSVPERIPA